MSQDGSTSITMDTAAAGAVSVPEGVRLMARFTPTMEDVAAGLIQVLSTDPDFVAACRWERRRRLWCAGAVALIAGLSVLAIPVMLRRWVFPNPWVPAAAAAGVVFGVYVRFRRSPRAFVAERAWDQAWSVVRRRHWLNDRERCVGLGEEGVWVRTEYLEVVYRWSGIMRCEATEAGVVCLAARQSGEFVPRSAFADDAAMEGFVAEVTARQRELGVHVDDVAARVLSEHDLPCPACGYSLKGCLCARCPECGESFDREYFERGAKRW